MPNLHRIITKILPVTAVLACMTVMQAQNPTPGKGDKPQNPPPYANQPPTGIGTPPEGTTPHDTPDMQKGQVRERTKPTDKTKSKKKAKKTPQQSTKPQS
jgi:outer membrane biosynthesis protein TonB